MFNRVAWSPSRHLFTEITMRESNNTPENGSKTAPKRIKELIDTYYPEIAERLKNGERNGK